MTTVNSANATFDFTTNILAIVLNVSYDVMAPLSSNIPGNLLIDVTFDQILPPQTPILTAFQDLDTDMGIVANLDEAKNLTQSGDTTQNVVLFPPQTVPFTVTVNNPHDVTFNISYPLGIGAAMQITGIIYTYLFETGVEVSFDPANIPIVVICFHPQMFINESKVANIQIGDKLEGEDGSLLTIIDKLEIALNETAKMCIFSKDCFDVNIPNKEIIITSQHYIKFNGSIKKAIEWVNQNHIGTIYQNILPKTVMHFVTNGNSNINFIWCNNLLVDTMGRKNKWYKNIKESMNQGRINFS